MGRKKLFDVYRDFSEFYDIYVGDWLEDLPFYLEYAGGVNTPVLEIGAGSGRLTIPLARAGKSVVAVDTSASMLAKLKSRLAQGPVDIQEKVQVIEADVSSLTLGDKYELIIVPFYTFNYFLTPESQETALERFVMHLAPKGLLLIDVFIPLSRIEQCPAEPILKCDSVDPVTRNRVRGWNVYSIEKDQQIESRHHIFEVTNSDGTVLKKEFATQRRYFYPLELKRLFLNNGFSIEAMFTGYEKRKPDANSEQLLYVLRHTTDR